jgi:dTDP-4-dehydrorhamnose reductase
MPALTSFEHLPTKMPSLMTGLARMGNGAVVILGGRGMLGSDLAVACQQAGFDVKVFDRPEFDVTHPDHIEQALQGAEAVVNCAAYTNVDGAESEAPLAFRVNAEAVGRLGALAVKSDLWILHVSTDFVFDGRLDRPYDEKDTPNPLSVYGGSKLHGERLLQESGCHACIVRIEWTYGRHGKNFVSKLLERARSGAELKVVDDQIGTPTATTEVAKAFCSLLKKRPTGLYHLAGEGYVSRFGVAQFIAERFSLSNRLVACKTSDFPSPAARPLNSRFDCRKIASYLDGPMSSWQIPLGRFLEQL